jgi:polygalacturonase
MKCDIYNIADYGAKSDGKTLNTIAINQAIHDCSGAGGGTVVVPPGEYLSGPIGLLENVTLHLDVGATVKGSPKLEDYIIETDQTSGESNRAGLLTTRDTHNITITGRGVIDGNAMAFVYPDKLH